MGDRKLAAVALEIDECPLTSDDRSTAAIPSSTKNSSEERPTEARGRPGNPRLLGMVLPIIVHARSYSGPPAQKHYGQIRASLSTR